MTDSKLESKILYVVVFMLLGTLLTLIWGMFTSLDLIGDIDKQLDRIVKITTILGVLITIATILIAMKSLKSGISQLEEMKIQRVHSQEPDLFIEPINLSVHYSDQDIVFESPWMAMESNFDKENLLPISITNIGNGVAKYVTLKLYFEYDFLQEVERLDQGKIFNVRILYPDYDKDIDGFGLFQYEYWAGNKNSMHNYDIRKRKSVQYNYIKSEETVQFLLDYDFMQILNLTLYLAGKVKSDENVIPRIKAIISYYDSFDNKYTKDVDIYIGSTYREYIFNTVKHTVQFELNALNRLPVKQLKEN